MSWVIETHALSKSYPREQSWRKLFSRELDPPAVDRVDLKIAEGEIFGLVGPNGAGKTTLVKMLSTLVLPTAGQAWVCGHPLADEQVVKSCIGLVTSDERSFYWRLSGRQNLEFFAVLQGLDFQQARQRAQEVLELVALQSQAERSFQTYSTGMRQRLAIGRALLVQPHVLFLDEPTRGLDPQAQADLLQLIRVQLSHQQRITVLITSHNLGEIERLCDRIAIIQAGRIRACGSLAELRASFDPPAATQLELGSPPPPALLDSLR
ncbi:MAG: ABC transporter ATP-binding protein, partial [Anaerolineales bacterium]|nr:ABC transporter ATP-binding protein [Anaerolineales bacterium]